MSATQQASGRGEPAGHDHARHRHAGDDARARLLAGLPVTERRLELAGIPTAVLEGGDGPPLVLLHGPGEFAAKWLWVIPDVIRDHHVVAPDLPAHGESGGEDARLDAARVLRWLDELIERTCAAPPVVVGHILGGSLAARYAARHRDRIARLVLVDTLGLAPFLPGLRFALTYAGFLARPNERSYDRFMRQCSYDLDGMRSGLGERWGPWVSYTLRYARSPRAKATGRLMRAIGLPRIPAEELERIAVPTTLIWGRHDRANRLRVAEAASARYGWPLHVIEDSADDPALDNPAAFLAALRRALAAPGGGPAEHARPRPAAKEAS